MTVANELRGETDDEPKQAVRVFSEGTILHLSQWIGKMPDMEEFLDSVSPDSKQLPAEAE
jgi:hypothetical protein